MQIAVTDEMIDKLTIAGTPDQGRHRLEESGDLDTASLQSPSYHIRRRRSLRTTGAMVDTLAA